MTTPTIRLTDILTDPMDGTPDVGAVLKFTQLTNTGTTLRTAVSELTIDETGLYDITLGYGQVQIEYKTDFQVKDFTVLGVVNISSETTATTIPDLVVSSVPPTDENVLTFQLLLAQTLASEQAAQESATNALASEQAAEGSATVASGAASTANSAASTATAARDATNVAAGDASTSAALAVSKAAEADASKIAANSSKVAAQASETASGISETAAAGSAQSASNSASAASSSEVNAKASETAANSSKVAAGNSATSASGSASTATTKASQASASATSASDDADTATSAASTATTKAGEASTSATTASDAANAANLDASVANAQATTATNQAGIATTQANIATTKAGESAASANQAQVIVDALPVATDAEIARVEATGTAEVGKVTAEGATQVSAVTGEGNTQVARVISAGNTQVNTVEVTGDTQTARVVAAGDTAVNAAADAEQSATEASASADRAENALTDLEVSQVAMSEAEFEANRAQNNEQFAASGFVHFGKEWLRGGYPTENVNNGLYTGVTASLTNAIVMGNTSAYKFGISKTDEPYLNIAGVITKLIDGTVSTYASTWLIKFPEAPDGTVTYDSTTGAVVQHSSAAEAFDYETTNSNFREGTTGWNTDTVSVSNSLATIVGTNARVQTVGAQFELIIGKQYIVDICITEARGGSIRYTTDALAHQALIANKVGLNTAIFTATATNYFFWCVDTDLDVSYISVRKATEEVVTDRVDMWGFESYLEEVNQTNPYVYPNGLPQSLATTMEGVATSASNRPVTYYAVFDGDTTSKGKGVNFFTATNAQKKAILANPKNNIYYDPEHGSYMQWRLRQRTIAGAGNGDWALLDPSKPTSTDYSRFLSFKAEAASGLPVMAQGMLDTLFGGHSVIPNGVNSFVSMGAPSDVTTNVDKQGQGIWHIEASNGVVAVDNECYFLVCGTVNRLNQGAYHPSFNPSGTSKVWTTTMGANDNWYVHNYLKNKGDCFNFGDFVNDTANVVGKVVGDSTYFAGLGTSGTPPLGRPDARYFNAIYASGQGGVCRDMRYSANGVDPVDFDEADLRVKSGEYRGFEKLRLTKILPAVSHTATAYQPSGTLVYVEGLLDFVGDSFSGGTRKDIYVSSDNATDWYQVYVVSSDASGEFVYVAHAYGDLTSEFPVGSHILVSKDLNTSVGGSFLQTDVIGDPANILQIDALKNGWEGSWIPVIPDGTSKEFPFTRKIYTGTPKGVYTQNNGASWITHTGFTYDLVKNSVTATFGAGLIFTYEYQAVAKQTEPANNTEVYGGANGVGEVEVGGNYQPIYASLFMESVLGIMPKSSAVGTANTSLGKVFNYYLPNGSLGTGGGAWNAPTHISLESFPNGNSPAYKALDYNVNINQQGFKQYAATELKHDGADWGDDSKVTIVDGESTKTDLNGNTVKVVTHKLKEPIGWIKNEV